MTRERFIERRKEAEEHPDTTASIFFLLLLLVDLAAEKKWSGLEEGQIV